MNSQRAIREKVAWAICDAEYILGPWDDWQSHTDEATAAITAFLEAAAEQGWHMRPDEATEEMIRGGNMAGWKTNVRNVTSDVYRTMLAAAPEFELDK